GNKKGKEKEKEKNEKTETKKNSQPPGYTVTVSEEAQKTDGITTTSLKQGLFQNKVEAYGEVLSPEGLNESSKNYIAAITRLQQAEAVLGTQEKEYARLKALNSNGKNISDRELQAAAARLASDKAEETHALGALRSAKDEIKIKWGPVIPEWIFLSGYNAHLREVLEAKDVLVQLTLSPSAPIRGIPKEIEITPPAGGKIPARFVSRAATADPRIQGISFIYVASSGSGSLVPGMNVTAQMPSVQAQAGFVLPLSAVVWLQDKAWVYVKKSATGFLRVEAPTSDPVNGGYLVSGVFFAFSPVDQIVIKGAQALLSEESTPKATGGGGEEEDND
ncbi:MAG: hypothetical protein M0018_12690, partial [Nitrospiraceae bacterium]|nr:hypothetical protein [Nitrospiraceae bacterium]